MRRITTLLLITLTAALLSGCKPKLIDKVTFGVNPNLETARVTLLFDKSIEMSMGGTYPVKGYGNAFVNPSSTDTPFNVGFELNLEIMNDNEYATYKPTTKLPTGQALPGIISRALAQVTLKKDIPNVTPYVYVDVPTTISKGEWLGVAVTIDKIDSQYFPSGLTVSQDFLKDSNGVPRATALAFGPSTGADGVEIPGGIALFANVRALIKDSHTMGFTGSDKGFNTLIFFNGNLLNTPTTL